VSPTDPVVPRRPRRPPSAAVAPDGPGQLTGDRRFSPQPGRARSRAGAAALGARLPWERCSPASRFDRSEAKVPSRPVSGRPSGPARGSPGGDADRPGVPGGVGDLDARAATGASEGLAVEFGVYTGGTLAVIAQARAGKDVYGFDSLAGLPEDWRSRFPPAPSASTPFRRPQVPNWSSVCSPTRCPGSSPSTAARCRSFTWTPTSTPRRGRCSPTSARGCAPAP
jgi:hypothetical protein